MIIKFKQKDLQNNTYKINQIFQEEKTWAKRNLIKPINFNNRHCILLIVEFYNPLSIVKKILLF